MDTSRSTGKSGPRGLDRLRGTWDVTRRQVETKIGALEERARHTIVDLEKKAKGSIDDVPEQLRGAWHGVLGRLREGLDVATREDLSKLSARVEELAKKVDKLARARSGKPSEPAVRKPTRR